MKIRVNLRNVNWKVECFSFENLIYDCNLADYILKYYKMVMQDATLQDILNELENTVNYKIEVFADGKELKDFEIYELIENKINAD